MSSKFGKSWARYWIPVGTVRVGIPQVFGVHDRGPDEMLFLSSSGASGA
jgi:hypothetical protein